MLRRCLRLSSCSRFLSCMHGIKFHTNTSRVLFSSFDKDLPYPNLPTPLSKVVKHDTDILLDQLKRTKSVEAVLDLASNHLEVMNAHHVITCLQNIHDFSRTEENFNAHDLLENQAFQSICTRIMKLIRVLDPQDLITAYKVLSFLGVRNNTYVMQSILKMIGGHLNNMNLSQITFLYYILSRQKHNELVDGLRLALPLVLQVQIEQQLDSDNMNEVVDCLQLACRTRLKPVVIQKIIQTVIEKAKTLSPNNAVTVMFALLNLDTPVDGYKELINYSFEIVSKNIDLIDPKHILPILRVSCIQGFYHFRFFHEVSKKIEADNWNLENTWEAASLWRKLGFWPENLVNHLTRVICTDAGTFVAEPRYLPLNCVEFLTTTGYHSPHLKEVLALLCTCEKKIASLKEEFPVIYIKFLSSLGMLGHFPQSMLSEIMNEDYLYAAWSRSRKKGRVAEFEKILISLAWSFQVYDQQDNFSLPPSILKSLVLSVCERHANNNYPLQKFIEDGLGGEQFLQTGVFTQDGLIIDHVLAMRSGNYPVALYQAGSDPAASHRSPFIEDLTLPPDAKIISVIVANEGQYIKDPEVLKGWVDLKIKCLRKKKFYPVVVNYSSWKNLPDREKIPYLMREIKDAFEEDCSGKTNTSL